MEKQLSAKTYNYILVSTWITLTLFKMNKNTKILLTIAILVAVYGITSLGISFKMNKKLALIADTRTPDKKPTEKESINTDKDTKEK